MLKVANFQLIELASNKLLTALMTGRLTGRLTVETSTRLEYNEADRISIQPGCHA